MLFVVLSGCAGVAESVIDPQGYTQRTQAQADAQRTQAEAQRAFAQSQSALANAEAERSRSEAQRAQAEAQKAQAEANAQARQAEANAQAFSTAANAIKDAAAQNRNAVIFAIFAICLLCGWMVWHANQTTAAVAQAMAARPAILPPPAQHHQITIIPAAVQLAAEASGLTPTFDGERWLLVDASGNIVQRQRLITTT